MASSADFEAEYRQPLLRGAGIDYNRIAGPNSPIGQYNGVLIARINTDVSLADFEAAIIEFVNSVETAYWALYFAYHDLEARVAGRNSSLLTWQRIKELQKVGARGGDAAAEAQARSQYYNFDVQVKEASDRRTWHLHFRAAVALPARDARYRWASYQTGDPAHGRRGGLRLGCRSEGRVDTASRDSTAKVDDQKA